MDKRNEAQDLYCQLRLVTEGKDVDKGENLKLVKYLIYEFLVSCQPEERFQFPEFSRIIEVSASAKDFSPEKASIAFQNLEIYLILILKNPWKPEFHNIKKYCGYYQSKIESHLKGTQEVFKFIGYRESNFGVLTLIRRPTKEIVLAVAFECLVASVECTIIDHIGQNLKQEEISFHDIVKYRKDNDGDIDKTTQLLRLLCSQQTQSRQNKEFSLQRPSVQILPKGSIKSETIHTNALEHADVPYIDDDARPETLQTDYHEGTLDDHLMASLRLVSKERVREHSAPVVSKGSEEWSYVRDGLKNKYGERYFDGQRGDLLRTELEGVTNMESDRFVANIPVAGQNNKHVGKLPVYEKTIRDSGYVGSLYHQPVQVHYPPSNMNKELTARAGSVEPDTTSILQAQVVRPKVSASGQLSSTVEPSIFSRSLQLQHTKDFEANRKFSSPQEEQFYSQSRLPHHNFSHSAPIVRKEVVNVSTGDHWTCTHCTSLNTSKNTICDLCSKSRTNVVSSAMPTSRVCSLCTLENQPDKSVCEACGTQLSGLQTNV